MIIRFSKLWFQERMFEYSSRVEVMDLGWSVYITSCHPLDWCVCACVYSNFSWVHFLFICWCSHWHPFLFDSALEGDEVTANINLLRYLARLMFWREAYFGILRVSPVYIGATTGQLLLEQRYLIDIKFDSDLWYFQGWITYYKTNLVKHWF